MTTTVWSPARQRASPSSSRDLQPLRTPQPAATRLPGCLDGERIKALKPHGDRFSCRLPGPERRTSVFELWPQRLQERHHRGRAPHGERGSNHFAFGRAGSDETFEEIVDDRGAQRGPDFLDLLGRHGVTTETSIDCASVEAERAGSTSSTSCRYARRTAGSSGSGGLLRMCTPPSRDRSRRRGRPWRPSPGDRPPRHEVSGNFVDVRDAVAPIG